MMKKILTLLFVASTMLLSAQDKVDLVDPRIGQKAWDIRFLVLVIQMVSYS